MSVEQYERAQVRVGGNWVCQRMVRRWPWLWRREPCGRSAWLGVLEAWPPLCDEHRRELRWR